MKKKLTQFKWFVTTFLLVAALVVPTQAWADIEPSKPSGEGTSTSPYQISTAAELYWFAGLVNGDEKVCTGDVNRNLSACATLTADITVNSGVLKADGTLADDTSSFTEWTPMGDPPNQPYNGTFEGANHTISGLYFNNSTTNHVGLFGGICGTVMNVGVIDSYFKGQSYVGGVCGMIKNYGTITNCYNKGAVSGYREVGGVCGWMYSSSTITKSTITDCYNTGKVSGKEYVGGVCGSIAVYDSETATVTNCYNTGSVSGTSAVGGVCGINGAFFSNSTATVNKCYNTGAVSGSNEVGGVCGRNTTSPSYSTATVINCYNIGAVSGYSEVGGVCGNSAPVYDPGQNNAYTYIKNCYNIGTVSGTSSVGGVCGSALFDFQPGTSYYSKIENCYYNTDIYSGYAVGNIVEGGTVCTKVEGKTSAKFRSGEVAYLLFYGNNDGVWGQAIGTDPYPVLGGDKVYYGYADCDESKDQTYSNTELADTRPKHNYVNGFCTKCGEYQPATLTTDKYDINGDNTKDEVYEIGNAGQLYWFAALVNGTLIDGTAQNLSANAVLVNDITVNTGVLKADGTLASDTSGFKAWTPIVGNSYPNNYAGTFDGQNHTVSGLYFNDSSANKIGLFGHLGSSGKISNVGVVDSYFCGYQFVGGVCGAKYGAMENCYSASTVSGTESVGGVCGNNFNGKLLNCYNTGAVIGTGWYIGGVCGIVNSGKIENCYSTGTVSGSSSSSVVGGVCGMNNRSGTISNCYFDSSKCDKNAVGLNNNGTVEKTEGKTSTQFENGEVAYLLNNSVSDGTQKWYQTIGEDSIPTLNNARGTVYYATLLCGGEKNVGNTYANTQEVSIEHDYNENGFCTVCGAYQPALDSDGDGYLEIGNAGQLYWFADKVNNDNANYGSANAVLTADITVNKDLLSLLEYDTKGNVTNDTDFTSWTPVGNEKYRYAGTFDGENHTVSGLYFNDDKENDVGFFGFVEGGNISNVGVVDSYFNGRDYTGGVCGRNVAIISNCYNTGVVSGSAGVGGVCGLSGGIISNCYNTGTVSGSNDVGGVCGSNMYRITNCYNAGAVSGTINVGGVCGLNKQMNDDITEAIANCYNTGSVSGTNYVGGVCGGVENAAITNCYFDSTVYNGEAVGNNNGGTVSANVIGKTTAQFNSGEVAYLLSQGCTVDDILFDGSVWGQTIGTDPYPVLGGLPVYYRDEVYTNTYGILTEGTQTITASNEPLVWYEFTPTETGSYQFSSTQLTAGNLYVNTTKTESDYTDIATSPTYDLEAATTYYVAVSGAPGSYDLTITRLNNTPTAIETVTAPQIYAVDGRIVCEGEFRIYDLLGRDVTRLNGSLCGVYIVKTANAAVKVVVR